MRGECGVTEFGLISPRDTLAAIYGPVPLGAVVEFLQALADGGLIAPIAK